MIVWLRRSVWPMGLRVEGSGAVRMSVHELTGLGPPTRGEGCTPVGNDVVGKAVQAEDVAGKVVGEAVVASVFLEGIKCASLMRRSTTTRTQSKPEDTGRSVMRSHEMEPQGREGMGSGCRRP